MCTAYLLDPMTTTTTARTRLLATLAVLCAMLIAAPAANAGLSTWNSLLGLTAPHPSWVRVYTTGTPPTTMYAGTEGDGVYRSLNAGGLVERARLAAVRRA